MKPILTALGLAVLLALANYWALWNLGDTACIPCAVVLLAGPFVLALALAGVLPALSDAPPAGRPAGAKPADQTPQPKPVEPPENVALRLLASLQEEGRLVDPHRGDRGLLGRADRRSDARHP
jgi:hypothetical protein